MQDVDEYRSVMAECKNCGEPTNLGVSKDTERYRLGWCVPCMKSARSRSDYLEMTGYDPWRRKPWEAPFDKRPPPLDTIRPRTRTAKVRVVDPDEDEMDRLIAEFGEP